MKIAKLLASKLLKRFSKAHIPTAFISLQNNSSQRDSSEFLPTDFLHLLIFGPTVRRPLVNDFSDILKTRCNHPLFVCVRGVDLSAESCHSLDAGFNPVFDCRVGLECAVLRLVGEADIYKLDPSTWVEISVQANCLSKAVL